MTSELTLCFSLVCMVGVSVAADSVPLACNLKAISTTDRPRYNDLTKRLRVAIQDRRELPDGYAYKLDTGKATLMEVAEWITMERLCCPFLTFHLEVKGNGDSEFSLRGPSGAKAIISGEFPVSSK